MDNGTTDDSGNSKSIVFPLQGWQCPVCRRVNAPWVSQCPCNPCGYPKYPVYPTYPPAEPQWPTVTCYVREADRFYTPEYFHE